MIYYISYSLYDLYIIGFGKFHDELLDRRVSKAYLSLSIPFMFSIFFLIHTNPLRTNKPI